MGDTGDICSEATDELAEFVIDRNEIRWASSTCDANRTWGLIRWLSPEKRGGGLCMESEMTLELTVALPKVCSDGRRSLARLFPGMWRSSSHRIGPGGRSCEADPRIAGPV